MKHLDKLLHAVAGFVIYICLMAFFGSHSLAFGAVIVAGVGKEVYDKWIGKGVPDFNDIYATLAGGVLALLVWSQV